MGQYTLFEGDVEEQFEVQHCAMVHELSCQPCLRPQRSSERVQQLVSVGRKHSTGAGCFWLFATDLREEELRDHVLVALLHYGIQRVPEHLPNLRDAQCRV